MPHLFHRRTVGYYLRYPEELLPRLHLGTFLINEHEELPRGPIHAPHMLAIGRGLLENVLQLFPQTTRDGGASNFCNKNTGIYKYIVLGVALV